MKTIVKYRGKKLYLSAMQFKRLSGALAHNQETASKYLDSFFGEKSRLSYLKDYRLNNHPIFFNSAKSRYNDFCLYDDSSPGPLYNSPNALWVGVEIECYIDGVTSDDSSSCEYCDGSNNTTCSCCEGDGSITLTDEFNYEHRVDCQHCGGAGEHECDGCYGDSPDNNYRKDDFIDDLKRHKITGCSLKHDGSLGNSGIEITLIFDASKGFKKLENLCKVLNNYNATVNAQCGLHVHIDRNNHPKLHNNQWNTLAERLADFIPQSRRENSYCRIQASDTQRYSAINLCNAATIEYRLHTGSTNFNKISNWIKLLLAIKNINKELLNGPEITRCETKDDLYRLLKLPIDLRAYFNSRYNQFNNTESIDDETLAG